jgi:hypothetical protein
VNNSSRGMITVSEQDDVHFVIKSKLNAIGGFRFSIRSARNYVRKLNCTTPG